MMKENNVFRNIDFSKLLWVLLAGLLCVILVSSVKRDFNHDEFEHIHSAWKILQGERIYIDFFQHGHPFYYYLLIPLLAIFGESSSTIIILRIAMFVMLLLILFFTYRLSAIIYDKKTALISVLLLSSAQIFVNRAIEARPDVPQVLFGLVSLILLMRYFEDKSVKHLVLSSFFLGVSYLFLQKTVFLVALIGCLFLINLYKKRLSWRDALTYLFTFLLTLAPYYVYLVCTDSLSPYFAFNYIMNTKFTYRFTPFNAIGFALRTSTLFCVFYGLGLRHFTETPNQKRIGWFSVGLLASTFLVFAPYKQYFMMSMPLVATTAAIAICSIFEKKQKWMPVVLLFAVVVPAFFLLRRVGDNNKAQLEKLDYVLSVTDKDDYVYDGDTRFNVFRKDIDFFWFSLRPKDGGLAVYKTFTEYDYNIYRSIDKFKPKVISSYQIENMQDERIAAHYVVSDKYGDLFIRTD